MHEAGNNALTKNSLAGVPGKSDKIIYYACTRADDARGGATPPDNFRKVK